MTTNDGGPAFPNLATIRSTAAVDKDGNPVLEHMQFTQSGMSLRDYFAAAALGHIPKLIEANNGNLAVYNIAEWAYEVADGMLRERERKPTDET